MSVIPTVVARAGSLLLGIVALGVVGCSRPRFPGPQIQDPPAGFLFDANATQGRNAFPDREILRQVAWFHVTRDDAHGSIFITAYPGPTQKAQAEQARKAQEERYSQQIRYGGIEEIRIDGRPAWGWLETQIYRDQIASLEYKAIVSYDSVTYAIEFHSDELRWMDASLLRETVMTFAVGRTKASLPGMLVIAIVVLVAFVAQRRLAALKATDRPISPR